MSITIAVCTRNNPVGLSSLLGSFVSKFRHPEAKENFQQIKLIISDGSDTPILCNPHLSRLLPCFDLTYLKCDYPSLLRQRLQCIEAATGPVWFIDDDHIHMGDFPEIPVDPSFEDSPSRRLRTYFGASVDRFNDKGYPDYSLAGGTADHSFSVLGHGWVSAPIEGIAEYRANMGNCLVQDTARLHKMLTACSEYFTVSPLIQGSLDDRISRVLAGEAGWVLEDLTCLHIGNSNGWWRATGEAKAALTDKMEDILRAC